MALLAEVHPDRRIFSMSFAGFDEPPILLPPTAFAGLLFRPETGNKGVTR